MPSSSSMRYFCIVGKLSSSVLTSRVCASVYIGEECTLPSCFMEQPREGFLAVILTCRTSHESQRFDVCLLLLSQQAYLLDVTMLKLSCGCSVGWPVMYTSVTSSMKVNETFLKSLRLSSTQTLYPQSKALAPPPNLLPGKNFE